MGNAQISVNGMLIQIVDVFFLKKMNDYIAHILGVFGSFKNCIDIKLMFSYFLMIFGFLFNVNAWEILAGLLVLILFDFVSAIAVAKATCEKIESKKCIRSAFKMFVYGIIISAGHLIDKSIGIVNWNLTTEYACLVFLSSTEFISILENFGKAGFQVPLKLLNNLKNCNPIVKPMPKNDCKSCK
jgi:phage-related holin